MEEFAIASGADIDAYLDEFKSHPGNVDGPGEWQSLVESVRRSLDRQRTNTSRELLGRPDASS